MPKLLHINAVCNYGSTGKIIENIATMAEMNGWTNYIACGSRYSVPSRFETYYISSVFDSYIAAIHSLLTDHHGFASTLQTRAFIRWINQIKPDVIHLHNIHSYYINVKILFDYLSKNDIPVIWTLHDCWSFTGHCSHFISCNCYKWETKCHDCSLSKSFPKSLWLDRSERNYEEKRSLFTGVRRLTLSPVSQWLADMTSRSFLKNYPINVVYNGVDTDVFKPVDSDFLRDKFNLKGKFVLLGVSTDWCEAKGLHDFIKLRKQLDENFEIVLIGMNRAQISKYAGTNILCILRTQSVEELAQWYSLADVVLNLSYAETFGLPVVEGFSCGTPAIVYDDTALSELITPETGYKVLVGDITQVVASVLKIKEKGKHSYSQKCRERALSVYDKRKNYRQYIDLYNIYCQ